MGANRAGENRARKRKRHLRNLETQIAAAERKAAAAPAKKK